jgi:hypothetical protein
MGELEDSVQRHPAGNARKETIWDTAWAISKAMQVGRDDEQARIIKLLEESDSVCNEWAVALIKGENK